MMREVAEHIHVKFQSSSAGCTGAYYSGEEEVIILLGSKFCLKAKTFRQEYSQNHLQQAINQSMRTETKKSRNRTLTRVYVV